MYRSRVCVKNSPGRETDFQALSSTSSSEGNNPPFFFCTSQSAPVGRDPLQDHPSVCSWDEVEIHKLQSEPGKFTLISPTRCNDKEVRIYKLIKWLTKLFRIDGSFGPTIWEAHTGQISHRNATLLRGLAMHATAFITRNIATSGPGQEGRTQRNRSDERDPSPSQDTQS